MGGCHSIRPERMLAIPVAKRYKSPKRFIPLRRTYRTLDLTSPSDRYRHPLKNR
jgi:hypothetical protein